jgi:hypothetical protein
MLLGLLVGAACGCVNGLLISKMKLQPFIATMGTQSAFRGLAYIITKGYPVLGVPDTYRKIFNFKVIGDELRIEDDHDGDPVLLHPDGSPVDMNLRSDDSFLEDEGWHRASAAYADFLRRHDGLHVLYFELGVGANTPVIIKYPFWAMALNNENAVYACLNYGEAFCPFEIRGRSLCIDGDIGEVLEELKK